ncbi:MAG: C4-dicarboxylate ABC transporter substrate-binding protein [Hyphomicrobiaceae bacterium]
MRVIRLLCASALLWAAAALTYPALAEETPAKSGGADASRILVAQAQVKDKTQRRYVPRTTGSEAKRKEVINAWTVGLAAGRIEGAPLLLAAELARVLDDGDDMRVLPIITRGPFDNIFDLLYLRGVDAAIVYADILEHFKKNAEVAGINKRVNYLMSMFPSELHIFARPEIKSLADLAGKPVNFNTKGTAAAYSGPLMLERLGVKVDARFDPHSVAMSEMKKGPAYAATVWVSSKPLAPFLKGKFPPGFKFLPVNYDEKLEYYLPSYLEHADYPAIIPEGTRIPTISVPAVLAVYDWPLETDRGRRMLRFVDYLMKRFPKLQKEAGYHPKWKDVNLAAVVPGWQRFKPMQDRLDKLKAESVRSSAIGRIDATLARKQAAAAAPDNPAEQERLFRQFLQWAKQKQRQ